MPASEKAMRVSSASSGLSSISRISLCVIALIQVATGRGRQVDEKGAALAGTRRAPDPAPMALGDQLRDRQAEAVAAPLFRSMQALEGNEQLVSITHVETAAGIVHGQLQAVFGDRSLDADVDVVARRREFPGVVQQVPQHRRAPVFVAAGEQV